MSDITLSAGVRQNLLSLQNTADLMATTQNRLATGKKVNTALDNATNFFTASSLQARSNELSALMDGMSNGVKTLEAADNGLTSITKTLESMQSTLRQARQDKTFETSTYTLDLGASPTGTETLSFSGGSVGAIPVEVPLTTAGVGTAGTSAFTYAADATAFAAPTAGAVTATFGSAVTFDDAGDTFTFDIAVDGGGTASVTITQAIVAAVGDNDNIIDDEAEFAAAITAAINAEGTYTVGTDLTVAGAAGDLVITSASTGTASSIDISNVSANDNAGADTMTNTSGLTTASGTGADADAISFNIAVDGDPAVTVTIDQAIVASVGNNDNVIDGIAEYQAAIEAGLTAAGVTGVTVSNDGTDITFTSDGTGTASSIAISAATADADGAGNANTVYGLDGATATPGTGLAANVAMTIDELVASINSNTDLKGKVRASNDSGSLRIENQSTQALTIAGASGGVADGGSGTSEIGGNTIRAELAIQFNELRDQLDKLSDDASYNGVNLLRGDLLRLTFNETDTSTIDIQTKNAEALNSAYLNLGDIVAQDLDADDDIDVLISTVKAALNTVRSQSSAFGSNLSIVENRRDFTKAMMNTLETGADNLVLADGNEEAANMLALQTRQQLSSTALSLASQADQAPLQLF